MYEELLGVKKLTPGWEIAEIRPCFAFDLTWAEGYHLVHGRKLFLRWEKDKNNVSFQLTVPEGCKAKLPLDLWEKDSIVVKQNSKALAEEEIQTEADVFLLPAGSYEISGKLAE